MDASNIKADSETAEYYLNRLIQRAVVEPKPLLKIYEEECQRHPDISVTVTFKEFQSALQRHCMTLQSRHQQHGAAAFSHFKQQEMSRVKELRGRFTSLGDYVDHRKRRRSDAQGQAYQRMQQSVSERFSPQSSQMNNRYNRNGASQASASIVSIKTEDSTFTSPSTTQFSSPSMSRPPSVQLPQVEEEPPPEFIEMSSNPPRISDCNNQFSGITMYQGQVSSDQNSLPTPAGVSCKKEPKETDSCGPVEGAVQSSTPLDKNTVLCNEDISPLNVRCVKCITALVTCAIMPCGHCCLCNICGQTVLSLKQVCPVCRKSISTVIGYSNLIYNVYR